MLLLLYSKQFSDLCCKAPWKYYQLSQASKCQVRLWNLLTNPSKSVTLCNTSQCATLLKEEVFMSPSDLQTAIPPLAVVYCCMLTVTQHLLLALLSVLNFRARYAVIRKLIYFGFFVSKNCLSLFLFHVAEGIFNFSAFNSMLLIRGFLLKCCHYVRYLIKHCIICNLPTGIWTLTFIVSFFSGNCLFCALNIMYFVKQK
jgi:hypothetical protein